MSKTLKYKEVCTSIILYFELNLVVEIAYYSEIETKYQ